MFRDVESARFEKLIALAWLEWRTNASYLGASPDTFESTPPQWFIREELGFGAEHGPSLAMTFAMTGRQHALAAAELGDEAPITLTKKAA